ncbi:MAG: prepilin peptidase [Candidatus Brocadiaceae bacterium]|nr:prepilin peptidase [Candidatus Brocadiaceae bacterium]
MAKCKESVRVEESEPRVEVRKVRVFHCGYCLGRVGLGLSRCPHCGTYLGWDNIKLTED